MKVVHLAMWVKDIEAVKAFYVTFFKATPGEKYYNPKKQFTSYFLSFPESEVRLELMHNPGVSDSQKDNPKVHPVEQFLGLAHFAIGVGSKTGVDLLTAKIRNAGYTVIGAPRMTGDGYYESVILDPEGNIVEITE